MSTVTAHTLIKYTLGTLLVLVIVGYALFQARFFLSGPSLSIVTPENGSALHDPLTLIRGTADHITRIEMNDRQIFVDETGTFEEPVLLSPGYNVIEIAVEDRFGRTKTEALELVLESTVPERDLGVAAAPIAPTEATH